VVQPAIASTQLGLTGGLGHYFFYHWTEKKTGPRDVRKKKRDEKSERKETEGKRRGARMRRGDRMDDDDRSHAQIPTSFGPELRACLRCRLVKTYDQVHAAAATSLHFLRLQFSVLLSI
jgi:hypothetical protein